MNLIDNIKQKLQKNFDPSELEVIDQSLNHEGHEYFRENQTTHIKIIIKSLFFEGKSQVIRHRLIYQTLQEEILSQLHAISIEAKIR